MMETDAFREITSPVCTKSTDFSDIVPPRHNDDHRQTNYHDIDVL